MSQYELYWQAIIYLAYLCTIKNLTLHCECVQDPRAPIVIKINLQNRVTRGRVLWERGADIALIWLVGIRCKPSFRGQPRVEFVHARTSYADWYWLYLGLKLVVRSTQNITIKDYRHRNIYRSHLIALKILPLMMQLELYDVMFFIRNLKGPTDAFNIYDHVTFHTGSTRSSTHLKLKHVLSRTNSARHFYFNRMPRLWNSLPTIDVDQSTGSI